MTGYAGETTENEMRKLHVGTSPLTNRIYAGHVLKDGATWGEGKQDVTGAACGAVCEHVLANGGDFAPLSPVTIAMKTHYGLPKPDAPLIATEQFVNAWRAKLDGVPV